MSETIEQAVNAIDNAFYNGGDVSHEMAKFQRWSIIKGTILETRADAPQIAIERPAYATEAEGEAYMHGYFDGEQAREKRDWFKCDSCEKLLPTQNGVEKHKRYCTPPITGDIPETDAEFWKDATVRSPITGDRQKAVLHKLNIAGRKPHAEDQWSVLLNDEEKETVRLALTAPVPREVVEALRRADLQLQMLHGCHCVNEEYAVEFIADNKEQGALIKQALYILDQNARGG